MAGVLQTVMVTRWTPAFCLFLFSSSFYWKEVPVLGSLILDWVVKHMVCTAGGQLVCRICVHCMALTGSHREIHQSHFALTDRAVRRKRVECQELHPGDTKNLPATLRGGVELLGN